MATGIVTSNSTHSNVDLDTIFEPRITAKVTDIGITSNGGIDISNRFEAIGVSTPIANTGVTTAKGIGHSGEDLSAIFQQKDASGITWSGSTLNQDDIRGAGSTAGARWNSSGTCDGGGYGNNTSNQISVVNWLSTTGGTGSGYSIKYSLDIGIAPSGTLTTLYTALTSAKYLSHTAGIGPEVNSCTVTVSIKHDASGIVHTRQVFISAESL